jgi:hypothetical protein
MIIRMIIYHTYDWSRPYDHTSYAATEKRLYYTYSFKKRNRKRCIMMHARFIQFTESETQNYPSANNYCSATLTIDVVTKEREKVPHTRQRYHKRYHAARTLVAETMSN